MALNNQTNNKPDENQNTFLRLSFERKSLTAGATSTKTVEIIDQSFEQFGVALVSSWLPRHVGFQIKSVNGGQCEDEDQKCDSHFDCKITNTKLLILNIVRNTHTIDFLRCVRKIMPRICSRLLLYGPGHKDKREKNHFS
jgi:hypothetical protein